jgi:threonine/homoserine/homoserine lactone efflux protein
LVLIETSITKGARAAIIFDIGVLLADVVFILLAYYGSVTLLERIQDDPRIFLLGGVVLISFGLYTVFNVKTKKIITDEKLVVVENNNYLGLFLKGFFLNFVNIGVLAFWFAIVIAVSSSLQMNEARILKYFSIVIISFLVTDLIKITVAKKLKRRLTPIVLRKIRIIIGIFFIVFGIILASKRFIPQKTMDRIDNVIHVD